MPKVKISVGRVALHVDLLDTPTAKAILAAVPFESRATTWPGEVYFQAPVRTPLESDALEVVQSGEIVFRSEGESIIIGYGPTPCSDGDEIRLAARANLWGRTNDALAGLAEVEAGDLVRVEAVDPA
jgi:hypothetical protein